MFNIYHFAINPICLCSQVWTYLHSISNFRFHTEMILLNACKYTNYF